MARYFLNIIDGSHEMNDEDGDEFPRLDDARREAILVARELMAEALRAGVPLGTDRTVRILDSNRSEVARVAFTEALPSDGKHRPL